MNVNPIMIVVALMDKMEIQAKRHLILELQRFMLCFKICTKLDTMELY